MFAHARRLPRTIGSAGAALLLGGMLLTGVSGDDATGAPTTDGDASVLVLAANTGIGSTLAAVDDAGQDPDWESHRGDMESILDTIGLDYGDHVDDADLRRAAAALDMRLGDEISAEEVAELLEIYRRRAVRVIGAFGSGETAVSTGLSGVAERLGLPAGVLLGPFDLARMVEATEERAAERARTPRFASVEGVELRVPSPEAVLVGFHQSTDPAALQMEAIEDVPMTTLAPRGRGTPRRSAADISVPEGEEVVAPVSGEVVKVQPYALYGRYPDVLIHIVPDDQPDLLVTVLHTSDPKVDDGDTVEAGSTPIAGSATKFPFASQIDRYAGSLPHVHIEVRDR